MIPDFNVLIFRHMETVTIPKTQLKTLIREGVQEALVSELAKLRALALPYVSQSEQKDIEKRYKKPLRKSAKTVSIEL